MMKDNQGGPQIIQMIVKEIHRKAYIYNNKQENRSKSSTLAKFGDDKNLKESKQPHRTNSSGSLAKNKA